MSKLTRFVCASCAPVARTAWSAVCAWVSRAITSGLVAATQYAFGRRRCAPGLLKRTGSADDVVHALLYLIEADFVTGLVLPVDGGRLLGPPGPPI